MPLYSLLWVRVSASSLGYAQKRMQCYSTKSDANRIEVVVADDANENWQNKEGSQGLTIEFWRENFEYDIHGIERGHRDRAE